MITVLSRERVNVALPGEAENLRWSCWLELSDGKGAWFLPATAPGDLAAGEVLAHFEARADALYQMAQGKGYSDMWAVLPVRALLKALASSQGLSDSQVKEALSADATR